MHLHLSRAVPLLPGICNWIIFGKLVKLERLKNETKIRPFARKFFILEFGARLSFLESWLSTL